MYLEDGENPLALAFIPVAAYDAAQGPGASPTHLLLRYWYVTPGSHISVMSGECWVSFTTTGQALRKERCSHLSQELVYSLEQVESMGLARRCQAQAEEEQQLAGVSWSRGLHR